MRTHLIENIYKTILIEKEVGNIILPLNFEPGGVFNVFYSDKLFG